MLNTKGKMGEKNNSEKQKSLKDTHFCKTTLIIFKWYQELQQQQKRLIFLMKSSLLPNHYEEQLIKFAQIAFCPLVHSYPSLSFTWD